LWLVGFFYLLFLCLNWTFPNLVHWNQMYIWFGISGLIVADLYHFLLDLLL
jgi:hypothetical protein